MTCSSVRFSILILMALFAAIAVSYSDDGVVKYKTIGGAEYVVGESSLDVRLDSELVFINLYDDYYTVDATFWLFNEGEEKTIDVGFPEEFIYDFNDKNVWKNNEEGNSLVFFDENARKQQEYKGFETWVNDIATEYCLKKSLCTITGYHRDSFSDFQISDEERKRFLDWLDKNIRIYYLTENIINLCSFFHEVDFYRSLEYTITTVDKKTYTLPYSNFRLMMKIPDYSDKDTVRLYNNLLQKEYLITKSEFKSIRKWMENCYNKLGYCNLNIAYVYPEYTFITANEQTRAFKYNDIIDLSMLELDWLVKKVTLQANGVTTTRVRYSTIYLEDVNSIDWKYIYGSGMYWKGNIKKARFIVSNCGKEDFTPDIWDDESNSIFNIIDKKKSELILFNFEPENTMDHIYGKIFRHSYFEH